jgi:phage FluMu protein Com
MRTTANGDIEIKCPKCGFINKTKLLHGRNYVLEKKEGGRLTVELT